MTPCYPAVSLTCQCISPFVYGLRAKMPVLVYSEKIFLEKWPFLFVAWALADVASSLQA